MARTGWVSSSKGQSGKTGLDGMSVSLVCPGTRPRTGAATRRLGRTPARVLACACGSLPGPECGQVLAVTVAWQFTLVQPDKRGVAGAQPHRWSRTFLQVLTQLASASPASLLGWRSSPHRWGAGPPLQAARGPRQAVAPSVTTAYGQLQGGLGTLGQRGRRALLPLLPRGSEGVPHSLAFLIPEGAGGSLLPMRKASRGALCSRPV